VVILASQHVNQRASHAAHQKAVKEMIFAKELAKAKKERDYYLDQISKAKKQKAMMERKRQVQLSL
jgi:hypothetical protein